MRTSDMRTPEEIAKALKYLDDREADIYLTMGAYPKRLTMGNVLKSYLNKLYRIQDKRRAILWACGLCDDFTDRGPSDEDKSDDIS